jgi:hypothetical protein
VRSRSWAQDNQKEIACSMRLTSTEPHQRTNDSQVLCNHDCTKRLAFQLMRPVSASLLLMRHSSEGLFLLNTDAVKR